MIVRDHDAAVTWYERLLGRGPDEHPMDGLTEWQLTDTGWLQVFADAARAGHSAMTLGVDDLDQTAARLAAQGLDLARQVTPRGQQLGTITDPDGNLVVFAQDL
ncbi:MAG: Glyoxalase/bleomycin resistance protein/dioxygenase [Acidimicrobiales bacterium]|nr:Glyoxalase/bleomycin resistance protein/dioxygenase [Acidimicrobiales bacterium]